MRRIILWLLAGLAMGALGANDPAGSWMPIAPMPEPKELLGVAVGGDGRIYAMGGTSNDGPPVNARVYAYDPSSDTWTQVASLAGGSRRNFATATDLNGLIYAIGGYDFSGPPFALNRAERYDPSRDFWDPLPDMPTRRQEPAGAAGTDGRIYVMGGTDTSFQTIAVAEVFDPVTSMWTAVAPMQTPRTGFGAAAGPDGRIYVFGGYTGDAYVNTAEVYDPQANTWTFIAPMQEIRFGVAGATGPDGRIYAIGGYNGAGDLSTVEAYDPASGTWTYVASLSTAREGHGAATGLDGTIYAVGGDVPDGSAEAFTLASLPGRNQAPPARSPR